jgi:16S rRNA (cytosine967-C5)-methyltransferase
LKLHSHLFEATVECLQSIFSHGFYADKAIEHAFRHHRKWGKRDRHFVATTVFEMVRWWRRIWALTGKEPTGDLDSLRRAVTIYLQLQGETLPAWLPKVPEFRVLSDQLEGLRTKRAIWHSVPDWFDEVGSEAFGEAWEDILVALNQPAQVVLRANSLRCEVKDLQALLHTAGIESNLDDSLPHGLILHERENVFKTEAFQRGFFEVQDGSSQMIAPLLGVDPGMRVIDACAGAGGKTLHLAALMKNSGRIIALDISQRKLGELKLRARRAGVQNVEVREIESHKVIKRLHSSADRMLLDVPCTGVGVLRRNPDTKWKLGPDRLQELLRIQSQILDDYSLMVKPGGRMVYATCSILPQENKDQVVKFLERNSEWIFIEEKIFLPHHQSFDGFYAALLERKS